jgi:phosphoribosylanthranilate isomerase
MKRPVIKVCGVTRDREVEMLGRLGVDFFGLLVDVASPWTVSLEEAARLASLAAGGPRATLVARHGRPDALERLIEGAGVAAIQLGPLTAAAHVARLRRAFSPGALTIIQELTWHRDRFWKEEQADEYLDAGADWLLLDRLDKSAGAGEDARGLTIPEDQLAAFRERHAGSPLMLAGGVSAANVAGLLRASGARGVDVCSSVRRADLIDGGLVAELIANLPET